MAPVIKETLVCIANSTQLVQLQSRNDVIAARGPGATESRMSAQRAVQQTGSENFDKFVKVWEGEYTNISMSSKWLAALSKEAAADSVNAAEGARTKDVTKIWEAYARDLQVSNSLMAKIREEGESARLGIDACESGRRRRYCLSRVTRIPSQRLSHLAPVDSAAMEIKLPVRKEDDASDDEDVLPLSPQRSINQEEVSEVMAATAALAVAANRGEIKKFHHECSATTVTPLDVCEGIFQISDTDMIFKTIDKSRTWSSPGKSSPGAESNFIFAF